MAKLPPYAELPTKPAGPIEQIEPNEEERRNGWTTETLSLYVHQRRQAEKVSLDPHHPSRRRNPQRAKTGYSPFTWRRKPRIQV